MYVCCDKFLMKSTGWTAYTYLKNIKNPKINEELYAKVWYIKKMIVQNM